MLQQTSVARVQPKFEAFIEKFPNPTSLARAPLGDALRMWDGLGYPRRCRNLQATAVIVSQIYNDELPESLEQLLELPGIGQYTARAILAFAYKQDVAVVDTNVSRVLSRLDGVPMSNKALQVRANELVPQSLGWEWNQVMMDFGARHCTLRRPLCDECPVREQCVWHGEGIDPAPKSGGASKPQPKFEGSDRQARGRAIRAVASGRESIELIIESMKLEHDIVRASQLIEDLLSEKLITTSNGVFTLP